ncbi:hypothetical protein EYB33_12340 [Lysinibacillus sphaericus]|uniref:KAP family P-loop NTPase fold protein n=1 Tax=Lysinibacillus sphaericus TaxID=1421 RepID=UPI001E5A75D5|nr:P-loop NTPase fold protein [Lysinibacillus sphaericus]UDK97043.1 hypothetical protein EYB33_12340 [Lysinibacillus sphaericus]
MNILTHLPLRDIEEDRLGTQKLIKQVVNIIDNHPSYIPYAISINGAWGTGKSTVLNFLENDLDKEKYTIIRFNSWDVTDENLLIRNLFEEVQYALSGIETKIVNGFKRYSAKLLPPIIKPLSFIYSVSQGATPEVAAAISEGSKEILNQVVGDQSEKPLSIIKKELAELLKTYFIGTDKKIIVMIDEVDRLFPDELIMILQMIKSGLDLPGIVFVLAADREVILNALNTINITQAEEYLDKIFQKNIYINSEIKFKDICTMEFY